MRWSSQRRPAGFNLAFLDIMACGLGAIILIFMLVKYHTDEPDTESGALQSELNAVRDEIRTIESANTALTAQLESLKQKLAQRVKRASESDEAAGAAAAELIALTKKISALEKTLAQQKPTDTDSANDKTVDEHLIGLRVAGARILILLDNSASMADERLVDIVKLKAAGATAQKAAPKWRRAVAVVDWILDRVPDGSEYLVVHYNATANFLTDQQWRSGGDRAAADTALANLHPTGATNLHAALALINDNAVRPTDVYVITDSLPTQGPLPTLRRLKACGVGNRNNVSGACRNELFFSAIRSFQNNARVNAVLLPIEGDPDAAAAYWLWAAATTGMMISPVPSWP